MLLLDKAGRIKPCGGAIPPRLIRDFQIPDGLICAKILSARMIPPSARHVDMPIDGGYVGMVNRETFDEWLRERARLQGAERRVGRFESLTRDADGVARVNYLARPGDAAEGRDAGAKLSARARMVIGADGAVSAVGKQCVPGADRIPFVFAYHEIVRSPEREGPNFGPTRCDVIYDGRFSPDFYSWVFPHGDTTSIGTGSANKGFSLRQSVADCAAISGSTASPPSARRARRSR